MFLNIMSELRQFLIGSGLMDDDESLSQGLDRLDQLHAEVLQDYNQPQPSTSASTAMLQGEHFIFLFIYLFIYLLFLSHVVYFTVTIHR